MGDTVITRGDVLSAVDSFNHFAIRIIEYECVEPATTMVASLLSLFNAFLRFLIAAGEWEYFRVYKSG